MLIRLGHLHPVQKLQSSPRLPPEHGVQDSPRMRLENIQQPGIRAAFIAVGEPRLRGRLRAHQDVHDPDELRQGMGSGVSSAGRHLDALLDRDSPARALAVAGQGAHPDGQPAQRHQLGLVNRRL